MCCLHEMHIVTATTRSFLKDEVVPKHGVYMIYIPFECLTINDR